MCKLPCDLSRHSTATHATAPVCKYEGGESQIVFVTLSASPHAVVLLIIECTVASKGSGVRLSRPEYRTRVSRGPFRLPGLRSM